MDLGWVAIAVGDVVWITLAFSLGFLAKKIGLPPLVGFLVTGFILNTQEGVNNELFQKLADIGITLLLFTVGLKINLKSLMKPYILSVTGIHMAVTIIMFGSILYGLAILGVASLAELNFKNSILIAFALSFSSTVFAVKVLEDKGELKSLHGRIAIGILVMQDILAVIFLAFSTNKLPSVLAFSLLLLIPFRFVFHWFLQSVGRGELLVLYGFILAMGGAELFELVGIKGDIGALIFGMLLATHSKADDIAKSMTGFKDLFLLGFFISIGLSGHITLEILVMAIILTPFVFLKSTLFFILLLGSKLRARTSLLTTINLTNYSEFGLIVAAIAANNNWINNDWLIIIALAMSFSFIVSAIFNSKANLIFSKNKTYWRSFQRKTRLKADRLIDVGEATIMVIGMGSLGTGTYDKMRSAYNSKVIGVDIDPVIVKKRQATERNIIEGDPSDADFWDRIQEQLNLELILLTLPKFNITLAVLEQLKEVGYTGQIAATTRYQEETERLKQEGILTVANIFTEAGSGFANHVTKNMLKTKALKK